MWYNVLTAEREQKKNNPKKKIAVAVFIQFIYKTDFHSFNEHQRCSYFPFQSAIREVIARERERKDTHKKLCGIFFLYVRCLSLIILCWANIYIEKTHTASEERIRISHISCNIRFFFFFAGSESRLSLNGTMQTKCSLLVTHSLSVLCVMPFLNSNTGC